MDDDFMTVVFSDQPEAAGLLLRIILGQPDLFVTEVTTQKEIRNPYGHSVRLDIEAADSHGRRFNVEVQRSERGAVPQRARYHSSMMGYAAFAVGAGLFRAGGHLRDLHN